MTPADRMRRWQAADDVDDLVERLVADGLAVATVAALLEGAAAALRDAPAIEQRLERGRLKLGAVSLEKALEGLSVSSPIGRAP